MKVPAEFKHELEESYPSTTKFFVTSRDGQIVEIYPMEEWLKYEEKLDSAPTSEDAVQILLDNLNYYGQVVDMDGQGRLLMPQLLRESAKLQGEVAVIGNLRRLLVRNMAEYTAHIQENRLTNDHKKILSEYKL